jgi:hypothetical protein
LNANKIFFKLYETERFGNGEISINTTLKDNEDGGKQSYAFMIGFIIL